MFESSKQNAQETQGQCTCPQSLHTPHTKGTITRPLHKVQLPSSLSLPPHAARALAVLESARFEAWCVGGFVRDALLGAVCYDIDIATNACWKDVQRAFEDAGHPTHETGTAHGTLTVMVEGSPIEITTYRADGTYRDGRHPDHIQPVRTIEEDLARRDFTVNALAYHPSRGLIDPFNGRFDLQNGVIRTVGDPYARFGEDALRILRACRFASQLGFDIEEKTFSALLERKILLTRVSAERITHELDRFVQGNFIHDALMRTIDILAVVLPELVAMKGFEQRTPYHIYDVLEHTAWVMQHAPSNELVRWAALFHDMGKPAAFFSREDGIGHFYGHAKISVQLARGIFKRLRFPTAFQDRVLTLVALHDDVVEPTPKAVKRMLAQLDGDVSLFASLCDLKRADARAQAPQCANRVQLADELEAVLANVLDSNEAYSRRKLAINGHDIIALGVPAGPAVGAALEAALSTVIDNEIENNPEALSAFVRNWKKDHIDNDNESA